MTLLHESHLICRAQAMQLTQLQQFNGFQQPTCGALSEFSILVTRF